MAAAALGLVACRWVVFVSTLPGPTPLPGATSFQIIVIGRVVAATIRPSDAVCVAADGRSGPCVRFRLVAPQSGTLTIRVSEDGGRGLLLLSVFDRTACCTLPLVQHLSVAADQNCDLIVMLVGGGATDHRFQLLATLQP